MKGELRNVQDLCNSCVGIYNVTCPPSKLLMFNLKKDKDLLIYG